MIYNTDVFSIKTVVMVTSFSVQGTAAGKIGFLRTITIVYGTRFFASSTLNAVF